MHKHKLVKNKTRKQKPNKCQPSFFLKLKVLQAVSNTHTRVYIFARSKEICEDCKVSFVSLPLMAGGCTTGYCQNISAG